MRRARLLLLFALAACAHALPTGDDDFDASPTDATTGPDGSKLPDAGSDGAPQQCTSPQTKCIGADGGSSCVDTESDPNHCGACTTECATADAGSLAPGPNNPDAGIPFDGGYDGGIGWSLGTPACDGGACAIDCPQSLSECSDGICYDTQNFHDHCGDCNTACQSTEWCTQGHCCSQGTAYCSGTCANVLTDDSNCGSCGHACSGGTPVCSGGQCVSAVTFSQAFTSGATPTTQCTAWNTFRTSLTGTYTSVTISGSNDTVGRTCTGANANTICQALHNSTTISNLSCGGYMWNVDVCNAIELTADGAACSCTPNPGYNARPCIGNLNWGGVNTTSCSAPSQTITVTCQ